MKLWFIIKLPFTSYTILTLSQWPQKDFAYMYDITCTICLLMYKIIETSIEHGVVIWASNACECKAGKGMSCYS